MKKTYFLDKIHNANNREFEKIMQAIVEDMCQQQYPHTFFKKGSKWLLEIEREKDLISVLFDDYTMITHNSVKNLSASYSNNWQKIFNKFLHKNQKYYYQKELQKIVENNIENLSLLKDKDIEDYLKL